MARSSNSTDFVSIYMLLNNNPPAQVSYKGSNLSTKRCQLLWHPKMPCASTVLGLLCSSIDDSVQQPMLTMVQIRWHIFISHETRQTVCIRELRTPQMARTRNPNYPSMPGNLITNTPPHWGRAEQPSHPAERLSEIVTRHPLTPEFFYVQRTEFKSLITNNLSWWDDAPCCMCHVLWVCCMQNSALQWGSEWKVKII